VEGRECTVDKVNLDLCQQACERLVQLDWTIGYMLTSNDHDVLYDALKLAREALQPVDDNSPKCDCGASNDPGACGHHPSCPMKKVEG